MGNSTEIERQIELLEKRLEQTKASKPAHDTTGTYEAKLLEIEDELAEKRKQLAAPKQASGLQGQRNGAG